MMGSKETCLGKLDVVAVVNALVDPIEQKLVGSQVLILNDQNGGAGTVFDLLLPNGAEGHGSVAGESVHEKLQRLVPAGAVPDRNELLFAILAVLE